MKYNIVKSALPAPGERTSIRFNEHTYQLVEANYNSAVAFAKANGYDKPKKREVMGFMLRKSANLDPKVFYETFERSKYYPPTSFTMNGDTIKVIETNLETINKYGNTMNFKEPSLNDLLNYMFTFCGSIDWKVEEHFL